MKKLYLFDVCGTLVNLNSTYEYINFLINKGIKKHYKVFFLKRYTGIIYFFLQKIFKKDFKRNLTVKFLKGLNIEELKYINKDFFKYYKKSINNNIFSILIDKKQDNDVFLLSASINPPIDFLKSHYNIRGFSSVLGIENGKYNGKLEIDLLGKKETVFKEKLIDIDLYDEIVFFTDNTEDISIINYFLESKNNIYVHIIPYSNKLYWQIF